ncbi:MAG: exo-alpha-sialidase [Betaproteobacteria bacterium]|nr:exo-alpha-sialidase [Betaproteobacteria bacterium]
MKAILTVLLTCLSFQAFAHEAHKKTTSDELAISLAFDRDGNLWRVQAKDGYVQVSHSRDLKQFSMPVLVNPVAQAISPMGESRPKIGVGTKGEIYVAWMQNLKPKFSSYIWFSRSMDGGKTFESPYIVHQDRAEIGHAFEAMEVSPDGSITMIWLDSRDAAIAKLRGKAEIGSAVYYAVSDNQGSSFKLEKKLADSSCECCRIATTHKPDGTVAVLWRHVFKGSERDHMIAEISNNKPVEPKRATYGKWKVDGCPHHGAALVSGGEGEHWWGYHMAWFDGGNEEHGQDASLLYARMDGEAWVSSPPKKFGHFKKQAGHPALLTMGENVWLVWREKDAGKSQVWLMKSPDEGRQWGEPQLLLEVLGNADYPFLSRKGNQAYLLWNTATEGLKVWSMP